jgi:hypothetical protein
MICFPLEGSLQYHSLQLYTSFHQQMSI